MLNLVTTSDVIRVVTSHAADIDVLATFVDTDGTAFTPSVQVTSITTATTTTVVAAPASGHYINVKGLAIANRDTADSTVVTVQFYNGTAYQIISRLLAPSSSLVLDDVGKWEVIGHVPRITEQRFATATTATYTTPVGCKSIFVECWGGGGGGGGCLDAATNGAGAGGGGAGEYACKMISNPSATYSYTVGAAGTGAAAGANTGGTGGTTSFGTGPLLSAIGGSGGLPDTVTTLHVGGLGGIGGTGGVAGDLNCPGQAGEFGYSIAAAQSKSGAGANSKWGTGGIRIHDATATGGAALGNGSGGAGGAIISSAGNAAGGAGAPGIIVVTEYY